MASESPEESTEEGPEPGGAGAEPMPSRSGATDPDSPDRVRRLEQIVVRWESQVEGLQRRVADLEGAYRMARRRALWLRLTLLLLLLTAYVFVRFRYAG